MNISPVRYTASQARFGNASGSFSDIVNRPQTYTVQTETPAASTNIKGEKSKKHKGAKIAGGIAVATAAIATGLALLATKTKILLPKDGGNQILNSVKEYLGIAGNVIADTAINAKDFIVSKLPKHNV